MEVLLYSKSKHAKEDGFIYADSLVDLYERADIVSLNCPLDDKNAKMIDADALSHFKKSAIIINTARGGLIDEEALARALNQERIAGAGLDVLSNEPARDDNPLLTAKNVVITPHVAWATVEARARLMAIASNNLKEFLNGNPINCV